MNDHERELGRCRVCGNALTGPELETCDRLHGTPGRWRVAVCARCGAGLTLPLVEEDQLAAFYPDSYGPYDERMGLRARAASRAIRAFQGWNALRTAPLAALGGRSAGYGLDVGCGRGDLAALLARHGWAMTGIEPSPAACEVAGARGIDVRCGTLQSVALEPEHYNAAVFRHSLEHTGDPLQGLRAVAEALAPGGVVLISVPNFASWQARRFAGRWFHLDVPRHRVHFTPVALRCALEIAGLEVLSISTSSSAMGLPASVQYALCGRCLFPDGLALRIATGLCALTLPLTVTLDRLAGPGDTLHAVARRPI